MKSRNHIEIGTALIVPALLSILGASALAQQRSMGISAEGIEGQPYTIREIGAIVVQKEKNLEVLFILPEEGRLKEYRDVDIRVGDALLMLNGKRVKTVDDLSSIIEAAETGAELKFGVKSDKDMRMLSFNKADPDRLPKMQTKMVTSGEGAEGGREMSFTSSGGFKGPAVMLAGSGIVAGESDSAVIVAFLMEHAGGMPGGPDIAEGDEFISLQGKRITALDQLEELYDSVKVGDTVSLVLRREGEKITVSFKKREPSAGPRMKMIKK
ncbi:MAG: hypothetical protein ACE5GA_06760 [Candidatus Zixiibacteriota bacterium]